MAPTVIAASSRQIPDLEQSPFGAMRRCGAGAVGCALHARHASIEEENRQAPPLGGARSSATCRPANERSAEAAAVKTFGLSEQQRTRLVVNAVAK